MMPDKSSADNPPKEQTQNVVEEERPFSGPDIQIARAALLATTEMLAIKDGNVKETQASLSKLGETVSRLSSSTLSPEEKMPPNIAPLLLSTVGAMDADLEEMIGKEASGGMVRGLFARYFGQERYQGTVKRLERERKNIVGMLSQRTAQLEDVMAYNDIPSPAVRRNRAKTSFGIFALIRSAPSYFSVWHQFAEIRTSVGVEPMEDDPYGQIITMDPGSHYSEERLGEEITENLQRRELPAQVAMVLYQEIQDFFTSKSGQAATAMELVLWTMDKPFFVTITKEQYEAALTLGPSKFIAELSRVVTLCQSSAIPSEALSVEVFQELHRSCYQKFSKATKDPFVRGFFGGKNLAIVLDPKSTDARGYIQGKETDPRMLTGGFLRKTIAYATEGDNLDNHISQVFTRFGHRFFHGRPARDQLTRTLEALAETEVEVEDIRLFENQTELPHVQITGFNRAQFFDHLREDDQNGEMREKISAWERVFEQEHSDYHHMYMLKDMLVGTVPAEQSYIPPEWFESYEITSDMYHALQDKLQIVRSLYVGVDREGKSPTSLTLADILLMAMHPAGHIRTANSIAEHHAQGFPSWDTYFNTFPEGFFDNFDALLDKIVPPSRREIHTDPADLNPGRLQQVWKTYIEQDTTNFLKRIGKKMQQGFAIMHREKLQAAKGEGTQAFFSTLLGRISYLESFAEFLSKQSVMVGDVVTNAIKNPEGMISIMSGIRTDETETAKPAPKIEHVQFASAQDEAYLRTLTENGYSDGFGIYGVTGNNKGWKNESLTISERILPNQVFEELSRLALAFANDPRYGFALDEMYSPRLKLMKKGYEVFLDAIRTSIFGDNPKAVDDFFDAQGWEYYKHEFTVFVNTEIHAHMRQNMERLVASSYFLLCALEDYAKTEGASSQRPLQLQFPTKQKEISEPANILAETASKQSWLRKHVLGKLAGRKP